jgi:hypothetical protein
MSAGRMGGMSERRCRIVCVAPALAMVGRVGSFGRIEGERRCENQCISKAMGGKPTRFAKRMRGVQNGQRRIAMLIVCGNRFGKRAFGRAHGAAARIRQGFEGTAGSG